MNDADRSRSPFEDILYLLATHIVRARKNTGEAMHYDLHIEFDGSCIAECPTIDGIKLHVRASPVKAEDQ